MTQQYEKELDTAREAVRGAGEIIRRSYASLRSGDVTEKRANDMVTVVDVEAQNLVAGLIRKRFGDDFIVAEESTSVDLSIGIDGGLNDGVDAGTSRRWYVDPLDGTTNYIHAYPMFACSVALEENGTIVLGVTFDPMRGELFHAVRGGGAYLNDAPIHVSTIADKHRTLLATGFPFRARKFLDDYLKTFRFFFNNSRGIRRGGSATLDLAYVAAGRVDAFWEMTLSPWDMAAGVILVEEAGGCVTNFYGADTPLRDGHIVATNGAFHDWMCAAIADVLPRDRDLGI